MNDKIQWMPSPPLTPERERSTQEQLADKKSVGLLLRSIGYSAVIFADPKVAGNIATSDDTFSHALARAQRKTLGLFGDPDSETVYVGEKEEIEGLYNTVGLKPVEIILGENKHFTLLSVTERAGSFAFNICLSGAPELTQVITVEALNDLQPRATF